MITSPRLLPDAMGYGSPGTNLNLQFCIAPCNEFPIAGNRFASIGNSYCKTNRCIVQLLHGYYAFFQSCIHAVKEVEKIDKIVLTRRIQVAIYSAAKVEGPPLYFAKSAYQAVVFVKPHVRIEYPFGRG